MPEGFGGYQSNPQPLGQGALLPVVNTNGTGDAEYDRWLKTNVREQRQTGYAMVTVRVDQGNLTADQMRGVARIARDAGDGLVRVTIDQNLLLGFIPLGQLPRVYAALEELELGRLGRARDRRRDHVPRRVFVQPGADQVDEPGRGAAGDGAATTTIRKCGSCRSRSAAARIPAASTGSPTSVSTATRARSTARKIPYYQMLLGGGYDETASCASAWPCRAFRRAWLLRPCSACSTTTSPIARDGESFRQYVLRHKVEFFRAVTSDLAKPAEIAPELYQDWGDDTTPSRSSWAAASARRSKLGQAFLPVCHTFQLLPAMDRHACVSYPNKL